MLLRHRQSGHPVNAASLKTQAGGRCNHGAAAGRPTSATISDDNDECSSDDDNAKRPHSFSQATAGWPPAGSTRWAVRSGRELPFRPWSFKYIYIYIYMYLVRHGNRQDFFIFMVSVVDIIQHSFLNGFHRWFSFFSFFYGFRRGKERFFLWFPSFIFSLFSYQWFPSWQEHVFLWFRSLDFGWILPPQEDPKLLNVSSDSSFLLCVFVALFFI